jgi:uncharacterized membrane protein YfcA
VTQILLGVVFAVFMVLFAFQMWRVWRTGHVRWRVRKHHRDHRPVAFWLEIAACVAGFVLFAGMLVATLVKWWAEAS